MEAAQVVLEEVMRAAMDAALKAAPRAASGDKHAAGEVFAYYNALDVFKEQAEIVGMQISDRELAAFDPDALLKLAAPRKAA